MKSATSLLSFLLCALWMSPSTASIAVPDRYASAAASSASEVRSSANALEKRIPRTSIEDYEPDGDRELSGEFSSGTLDDQMQARITKTASDPKSVRTSHAAVDSKEKGSLSGMSLYTTVIPSSSVRISTIVLPGSAARLSELADFYRSRSGFFFESPDAPGSGMRLMTITPSAPEIRILSPYQTDDTRESVPLPPAVLLLASGLAACIAVGKNSLQRSRADHHAT